MDLLFQALAELAQPARALALVSGVFLGLFVGVIPGLGGVFGLAILIPATYSLDPASAIVLLLAMASVTTTSDTIPAVMIGVPGTVGSAATVLDGNALAKKNQAARALGAAYSASMIGGLFGAALLALSIPILRPLVLFLNYGDLFAITVFGLSLVALLSGSNPRKGMLAAILGALVAYTGLDPFEGVERWSFGQVYFWDGIPATIVFLGLFGVSELADLARRGQVAEAASMPERGGMWRGVKDSLTNIRLVLRCSALGSLLGAVPGVGVTVIEWIAYGHAASRNREGTPFGQGNILGVIAPESANNAKEGGSLLPTIGFGIPGSAVMAILLGAFMLHGIVPGPELIESHAQLVVMMVATVAVANLLATGVCLSLTGVLSRIALMPASVLVPPAMIFVALGAFQANRLGLDLVMLIAFGALGLFFKRNGWSRPAFALGFVLAPNLERFFFLSYQISEWDWLLQPIVVILLGAVVIGIGRNFAAPRLAYDGTSEVRVVDGLFALLVGAAAISCIAVTVTLPFPSRAFPQVAAPAALVFSGLLILQTNWRGFSVGRLSSLGPDIKFLVRLVALCLLLYMFGYLFAAAAFIVLIALIDQRPGLKSVFGMLIFVTGLVFLIFEVVAG